MLDLTQQALSLGTECAELKEMLEQQHQEMQSLIQDRQLQIDAAQGARQAADAASHQASVPGCLRNHLQPVGQEGWRQ